MVSDQDRLLKIVRRSIIAYIALWVLEGAIRKWVPGTDQIFYVARDMFILCVIGSLGLSKYQKLRTAPWFWVIVFALSCLVSIQVLTSRVDLVTAAVGWRSYVAPVLLVYVVWCYASGDIVITMARAILIWTPIELGIAAIQVSTSPSSWFNKQVGSEVAGFVNGDTARVSGTFSAVAGFTGFLPIALALGLWICHTNLKSDRILGQISVVSTIICVLISGARTNVFTISIILLAYITFQIVSLSNEGLRRIMIIVIFLFGSLVLVMTIFGDVIANFIGRFNDASTSENSFERIIYQTLGFFPEPMTILGSGAGLHSMAGISVGSTGSWIEIESIRWVSELGVFGWLAASLRLVFCTLIILRFLFLPRSFTLLNVLVYSAFLPVLAVGSITQFPTAQGFFAICVSFIVLEKSQYRNIRGSMTPNFTVQLSPLRS